MQQGAVAGVRTHVDAGAPAAVSGALRGRLDAVRCDPTRRGLAQEQADDDPDGQADDGHGQGALDTEMLRDRACYHGRDAAAEYLPRSHDDAGGRGDQSARSGFSRHRPGEEAEEAEAAEATREQQREKRRDGVGLREDVDQHGGGDEAAHRDGLAPDHVRQSRKGELSQKAAEADRGGDQAHFRGAEPQVVDEIARHHRAQTEYAAHGTEQRQHSERYVAMLEQFADRGPLLVCLRAYAGGLADDARQQRRHDESRDADQDEGPTPAGHLQQLRGNDGTERETEEREGALGDAEVHSTARGARRLADRRKAHGTEGAFVGTHDDADG